MNDNPRIAELRRRVDKDPTSIAFAQLAEEYRRTGDYIEAVKVCREGLARHPGYLSAQVTLGRALMELSQFDEASAELEAVLQTAPDNLAAIRALAEIHQRRGDVPETVHVPAAVERRNAAESKAAAVEPKEPFESEEPLESKEAAGPQASDLFDITLDVPLLEEAPPVDLSLDATMPTFESGEAGGAPPAMTAADLPSFEALDALSQLPPMPDLDDWTLDADFTVDLPSPTFSDPSFDRLGVAPTAAAPAPPAPGPGDPVLEELEKWLAAIVADRSQSR